MNDLDSRKMRLQLEESGYVEAHDFESADIIIINSCAIREKPSHKAISEIGRALQLKKMRPEMIVGICGCVAQQYGSDLIKRFNGLDFVCGPDQILKITSLVEQARSKVRAVEDELIDDPQSYEFSDLVDKENRDGPARFVTIIKGCNYRCSYCIVPFVRGGEISRDPKSIIDEINRLVENNVKEVTLLGQNVTAYRIGDRRRALPTLISMISSETDISRIRFVAPHPADMTQELMDQFKNNSKLCPHAHIPVQSGCNKILREMRRGYTREKFIEIVSALRDARPEISITTDIIVGFPTETQENFEDTFNLLNEVQFDSIFAFKYSPRKGTKAFELKDDVSMEDKRMRLDKILKFQKEITWKKNKEFVGRMLSVLVIGSDKMKSSKMTGRGLDNRLVNFAGDSSSIGSILNIEIKRGLFNSLEGKIV